MAGAGHYTAHTMGEHGSGAAAARLPTCQGDPQGVGEGKEQGGGRGGDLVLREARQEASGVHGRTR